MKDALTVDAFVHGAPLHDDGYSQQDLLANVLLETGGKKETSGITVIYKIKTLSENTPEDKPPNAGYQQDGEEQRCRNVVYSQLQLIVFGPFHVETMTSLLRLIKQKQTGTLLGCLFSGVTTARQILG